jgi:hypothetical protein
MIATKRPTESEFPTFFRGYVDLVPGDDALADLDSQQSILRRLPAAIPREKERFAYAPAKWTLRQVAGHLGDGERVFGYRALCISRFDATPLPGFDENTYVANSRFDEVPLERLVDELLHVRAANLAMLRQLSPQQWTASGIANGKSITVNALAFVMAGHVRHHFKVLRERYGVEIPG